MNFDYDRKIKYKKTANIVIKSKQIEQIFI